MRDCGSYLATQILFSYSKSSPLKAGRDRMPASDGQDTWDRGTAYVQF